MKVNVHDPRGEELAQVLTRATAALAQVPSPRVDAELLAAHLLYDGSRSRLQHMAEGLHRRSGEPPHQHLIPFQRIGTSKYRVTSVPGPPERGGAPRPSQ